MPDGFGQNVDPVGSGRRALTSADPNLPARPRRPAAALWRRGAIPDRSPLARPDSLLRIFSRRQRRGHRRKPPDGMDRPARQAHATKSRITAGTYPRRRLDRTVMASPMLM